MTNTTIREYKVSFDILVSTPAANDISDTTVVETIQSRILEGLRTGEESVILLPLVITNMQMEINVKGKLTETGELCPIQL